MNNEEAYQPKKGWYVIKESFPKVNGLSFSFGLTHQPTNHYMDGYDKPMTHKGNETEFYVCFLNKQFAIGYKTLKKVEQSLYFKG